MEYLCSTCVVYDVLVGPLDPDQREKVIVVAVVATRNILSYLQFPGSDKSVCSESHRELKEG